MLKDLKLSEDEVKLILACLLKCSNPFNFDEEDILRHEIENQTGVKL